MRFLFSASLIPLIGDVKGRGGPLAEFVRRCKAGDVEVTSSPFGAKQLGLDTARRCPAAPLFDGVEEDMLAM